LNLVSVRLGGDRENGISDLRGLFLDLLHADADGVERYLRSCRADKP
jgi:hypothetical protein